MPALSSHPAFLHAASVSVFIIISSSPSGVVLFGLQSSFILDNLTLTL